MKPFIKKSSYYLYGIPTGTQDILKTVLTEIYASDLGKPSDVEFHEEDVEATPPNYTAEVNDSDKKEILLESESLTVVMWKEDGLYYVFDPKSRDPSGYVYGMEEWSSYSAPEIKGE